MDSLKVVCLPHTGVSHVHPRASSKETSPMVSYVAGGRGLTQVWVAAVVSTVSIYPVFLEREDTYNPRTSPSLMSN